MSLSYTSRFIVFSIGLSLHACFNPDFESKPCINDTSCPIDLGYICGSSKRCAFLRNRAQDFDASPEINVKGSSFMIGAESSSGYLDTPQSARTVADFYMDVHEVTEGSYRRCVSAGFCTVPAPQSGLPCNYQIAGRDQNPINCVTWEQAQTFCQSIGRRLPTEEEWEFAAIGPASKALFPGGDSSSLAVTACWDQADGTCRVETKRPTLSGMTRDDGFYDLAGNVWEYTSSSGCPYTAAGPPSCASNTVVIRGGSWSDKDPNILRATARSFVLKGDVQANRGFRCAR